MKGWLKQVVEGSLLLTEIRGLRQELAGLRKATEQIATLLQAQSPQIISAPPAQPGDTEVTFVNEGYTAEMMDIELRLTTAKGIPPTEDEMLAEYERRWPDPGTPLPAALSSVAEHP